jgi:hypothetical protein
VETVAPSVEPEVPVRPHEPASPGRGGSQHKYLQQLIKHWAEDRGYRVAVEKQILDGMGSVDVALEKGDRSIACEISISTSPEHELGNIQKRLAAGFSNVVALATEKKALRKIAEAAECLGPEDMGRVRFLLPEELFSFLEEQDARAATSEQTVRGYRVKVKHTAVSAEDLQAISQTMMQAMRRLKGKA